MFCTSCGNEIPDSSAFCTSCGKPVKKSEEPKMQPQTETVTTNSETITTNAETVTTNAEIVTSNAETVTSNTETVAVSTEAVEVSDEKALLTEGIVTAKNEAVHVNGVEHTKLKAKKEKKVPKPLMFFIKWLMIPITIIGVIGYEICAAEKIGLQYLLFKDHSPTMFNDFIPGILIIAIIVFFVIIATLYKGYCFNCGLKKRGVCSKCDSKRSLVSVNVLVFEWISFVLFILIVPSIPGLDDWYAISYVIAAYILFVFFLAGWNIYMLPAHTAKNKNHSAAKVIWWLNLLLTIPTWGIMWVITLIWSHNVPRPADVSVNKTSIQDRMKELEELKTSGYISEEEFEKKRSEILSQL